MERASCSTRLSDMQCAWLAVQGAVRLKASSGTGQIRKEKALANPWVHENARWAATAAAAGFCNEPNASKLQSHIYM